MKEVALQDATRGELGRAIQEEGPHAFPFQMVAHDGVVTGTGMTLRDWFAGLAMQAAATNPAGADGLTFEQRATWAYHQADAMLQERAK